MAARKRGRPISKETLEKCRRATVMISRSKGKMSVREAAEILGVTHRQLYYFIQKSKWVGIDGPGRKPSSNVDQAVQLYLSGFGTQAQCAAASNCTQGALSSRLKLEKKLA